MNQRPLPIGTRSQLFLDDYLIAASDGVEVQLHPMTKHPEPVLHAAAPWERPEVGGLWGPVHAHFDPIEQAFKLWYSSMGAYPADRSRRDPTYRCLVTSPDGLNWERPNLGLFEYAGSTRNNIFTDQADVRTRDAGLPRDGRRLSRPSGATRPLAGVASTTAASPR